MDITYKNDIMKIERLSHFDVAQCLCCGQAFRWRAQEGGFFGVALGRAVHAEQCGDTLTLTGVDQSAGEDFIRYFDLSRDYGALKALYASDSFLHQGMKYAHGIRVLNQSPFETLISFIISANNNVSRIMGIVDALCDTYGAPIGDHKDFPKPDKLASLTEAQVLACGAGYRAKFIIETARMVVEGFDVDGLANLPYEEAKKKLTMLPGVGPKVADCVLLYSLGFTQAFPADVWMKRVLTGAYGYKGKNDKQLRTFVDKMFGVHAGIAQQYLFHYARNNKDKICT